MTAPAATPTSPRITRFRPIYRCLGYVENAQGYRRYAVAFGDPERIVIRRAAEMAGLEFLLTVYADPGHWRHLFPRPAGRRAGVDCQQAAAWFVRECSKAGPFKQHAHLTPPVSAPRVRC
jgi:hypothetical protein